MGQAQINVRARACSRTSIARTKQAALTQCNGERVNSMNVIIALCHILKYHRSHVTAIVRPAVTDPCHRGSRYSQPDVVDVT